MLSRYVAIALLALLPACSPMPPFHVGGSDPSSPQAHSGRNTYAPVTSGYVTRRAATPEPWDSRNRAVAPGS